MRRQNMPMNCKAAFIFSVLLAACSGKSSGTAAPSPQSRIIDLSSDQSAAVCDRLAMAYGGYGVTVPCDSGTTSSGDHVGVQAPLTAPANQAACVAQFQMLKNGGCT